MIELMPASRQAPGGFNNGEILELRPVIYGHQGGGFPSYSNLFYWAYAWSSKGSTIGLHPHKGFEILSYVVRGTIEHYDTLLKKWIPLTEGSVQIIRSGSGISHSEKINPESSLFQIWFDPDLRKAMGKKATYGDFPPESFPLKETNGVSRLVLIGEGSPLTLDSPVRMERVDYQSSSWEQEIPEGEVLSWFQIEGDIQMDEQSIPAGDFARIHGQNKIQINPRSNGAAFLIFTPVNPGYQTYADS
jgi:redox-sensitive bicupin YhaK (pirin superfamily)